MAASSTPPESNASDHSLKRPVSGFAAESPLTCDDGDGRSKRCGDCRTDLRSIVDAAHDGVFVADEDGRILYANSSGCAASGHAWDELKELTIAALLLPEDSARLCERIGTLDRGHSICDEWALRRKDGSRLLMEVALQRLAAHRYLAIARDITERKRIEERDRTRTRVLELLAADAPLADMLQAIVLGVETERPGSLCSILLLDETGRCLRTATAPSLPAIYSATIDGLAIGDGAGPCGTAAFRRQRVIAADIRDDPCWTRFRNQAGLDDLCACWSEPILDSEGCCLGAFAIYQRVPANPGCNDLETIAHAAKLVSVAIDHSRRATALRQQDDLFRRLSQQIPGVIYQFRLNVDGTACFPYASETIGRLYELTPERVRKSARAMLQRIHPDDRDSLRESLLRSAASLQPWRAEYRVRLPRQGIRWREGHAVPEKLADGGVLWHGYAADITERKQTELSQRESEQRIQLATSVFGHAHEGIAITDTNACILDINQAGSKITGYVREEVIGQDLSLLKSSEDDPGFFRRMWKTLKSDGSWRGELSHRRKNGERYSELMTISSVRDSEGMISHYVVMFSDISSLKETQHRLEHLAHYDVLTQLPNRALVAERLQRAMARARTYRHLLAVCYLDLDGFKAVNDSLGHSTGDQLLIEVATRLKRRLRSGDTAARLGGDEFVLLLGGLGSIDQCESALARILADMSHGYPIDDTVLSVSASIGVTVFPRDDTDPDTLLRHADQAMYLAKQSGRNRYHLFDPDHDRLTRARHEALARMQSGFHAGEFSLHYQPKVDMRRGVVVGVEALVRWDHPQRGQLPPAEFLSVIENSELSVAFEDWILGEAIRQMGAWWQQGLRLGVSVNVSARLLQQENFVQRLASVLAQHRYAPPDHLELEVLENVALEDIPRVSANIEESRRLGVLFALDDFGTGYSSLTYLRRLPVSTLKIDRTFIHDMLEDPEDLAIVESVIQLAKAFGRSVIAEGVETAAHGLRLTQMNCDLAQGFGIAPPMPPERLMQWLKTYEPDPVWFSSEACRAS